MPSAPSPKIAIEVGSGTALEGNSPLNVAIPEKPINTRSPAVVVKISSSEASRSPITVTLPDKLGRGPRVPIPFRLLASGE